LLELLTRTERTEVFRLSSLDLSQARRRSLELSLVDKIILLATSAAFFSVFSASDKFVLLNRTD
jgi:hypothetical protein